LTTIRLFVDYHQYMHFTLSQ